MANHVSHASLPYPIKGARYTILIPYLDADGDPTDPGTPDTERSIDGAAFADCTEEASTITGSNGMAYVTLTGDEMACSMLAVAAKVGSGPKSTLAAIYPRRLPPFAIGTAQAGAAGSITLSAGSSAISNFFVGMIVRTTGGTGGGGGGGSLGNQARIITDYDGTTKEATIEPNWETTPDGTTTYELLITPEWAFRWADVNGWLGAVAPANTGDAFARLGPPAGASVSADLAAIEAQTDDIGAAGAGLTALATQASVDIIDNFLDTEIAAIIATLGAAGAGLTAIPWNAAWDAEVQSEVEDALAVLRAELAGVPAANASLIAKITWLATLSRNTITQTATTQTIFADDL